MDPVFIFLIIAALAVSGFIIYEYFFKDRSRICIPPCSDNQRCVDGTCCDTKCDGKECGRDNCGGECGSCSDNQRCVDGTCCDINCDGKECGRDNCGGECGSCKKNQTCVNNKCQTTGWNWSAYDEISSSTTSNADKCAELCDQSCKYWSYDTGNNKCTLYKDSNEVCSYKSDNMLSYDTTRQKFASSAGLCNCDLLPACDLSKDGCCPVTADGELLISGWSKEDGKWKQKADCVDSNGETVCCSSSEYRTGYDECIKNHPNCADLTGAYPPYGITYSCAIKGDPIHLSDLFDHADELTQACEGKNNHDECSFSSSAFSFEGRCTDKYDTSSPPVCSPKQLCIPLGDDLSIFTKPKGYCVPLPI